MIFTLKEDLVIKNDKGDLIVELKGGQQLTAISWEYIPRHVFQDKLDFQVAKAKKEAFAVYIRGRFIAVPKNMCDVPKTIGWRYNL